MVMMHAADVSNPDELPLIAWLEGEVLGLQRCPRAGSSAQYRKEGGDPAHDDGILWSESVRSSERGMVE